ncbi:hypothetical protein DXU07_44540 [Bradyrhizobium elkanii]|nr:hypothetical protein BLN97_13260 [Bradyrhizobium elkanii]
MVASSPHERSDMRDTTRRATGSAPDIAEPVIGRAFARPVGSSGLRSLVRARGRIWGPLIFQDLFKKEQ